MVNGLPFVSCLFKFSYFVPFACSYTGGGDHHRGWDLLFGAVSIHTPKLILHWSASCPSPQRNKVNDISDMSASKLLADRRNRVKWAMSEELELPEKAIWCWNESGSENIAVPSAFAQAAERGAGLVWHFLQSQTVRKLLGMWFFFWFSFSPPGLW